MDEGDCQHEAASIAFAQGMDILLKSIPQDSTFIDWILQLRSLHSDINSLCSEAQELMQSSKVKSIASMIVVNDKYNIESEEFRTLLPSDDRCIFDFEEECRPPSLQDIPSRDPRKPRSATQEMLREAASFVKSLFMKTNRVYPE
jgi:hypothetical protein